MSTWTEWAWNSGPSLAAISAELRCTTPAERIVTLSRRRKSSLLYESELSWFILVGALDVFMTYLILRYSGEGRTRNVMIEGNPVARWVLSGWGIKGMVIFKFIMIAVVSVIAEVVGRQRPALGSGLLKLGTLVVGGVVVYSFLLLQRNL